MTKRILSRQQKWRIEKIQQDRINRANKKSQLLEATLDSLSLQDASPSTSFKQYHGLVIKNYGQSLDVEGLDDKDENVKGRENHNIYRCSFRQNLGSLVAGDNVVWHKIQPATSNSEKPSTTTGKEPSASKEPSANKEPLASKEPSASKKSSQQYDGIITALKERKSLLARPDPYGNKKNIAANIDQILIINAPNSLALDSSINSRIPRLNTGLIDRYIVSAESNQIQAVIVINKIDLLHDDELNEIKQKLTIYQKLGYKIAYTSTLTGPSVANQLSHLLVNKNSILVGQSGVGKSSLLNELLPAAQAKTATVSSANAKGRHTTSAAQLYHLEHVGIENATIIDSPGIREFGLWDINETDVKNGFKEIKEFSQNCRFRDCKHESEPDCAIITALDKKLMSESRYLSYQKIIQLL